MRARPRSRAVLAAASPPPRVLWPRRRDGGSRSTGVATRVCVAGSALTGVPGPFPCVVVAAADGGRRSGCALSIAWLVVGALTGACAGASSLPRRARTLKERMANERRPIGRVAASFSPVWFCCHPLSCCLCPNAWVSALANPVSLHLRTRPPTGEFCSADQRRAGERGSLAGAPRTAAAAAAAAAAWQAGETLTGFGCVSTSRRARVALVAASGWCEPLHCPARAGRRLTRPRPGVMTAVHLPRVVAAAALQRCDARRGL